MILIQIYGNLSLYELLFACKLQKIHFNYIVTQLKKSCHIGHNTQHNKNYCNNNQAYISCVQQQKYNCPQNRYLPKDCHTACRTRVMIVHTNLLLSAENHFKELPYAIQWQNNRCKKHYQYHPHIFITAVFGRLYRFAVTA